MSPRRMAVGGGIGGVVAIVLALLMGVDPRQLLEVAPQGPADQVGPDQPRNPEEDELADFVSVVLADTEDVWGEQFRKLGRQYRAPKLVLFRGAVETPGGVATSSVGPFYSPADEKIYIDLKFYRELKDRLGAPGDFAQAYVIAHEVGHHVQKLLGTLEKVHGMQKRVNKTEANELSVRLELQADFYAGLWAHHAHKARHIIEAGDIEEGLNAASAIGDDRLQKQSQGFVVPDSFTHGTSAQRVRWFRRGLETGDVRQGDTFGALEL